MIPDLVCHNEGRDSEYTRKLIDVIAVHNSATLQSLLQARRWSQELGSKRPITLLTLGVRLRKQSIHAR